MKKTIAIYLLLPMLALTSCKHHYEVASMQRSRILVDSRYDAQPDEKAAEFLKPYKHQVDSVMGPVVGQWLTYWCGLARTMANSPTSACIIWVVCEPTCQKVW